MPTATTATTALNLADIKFFATVISNAWRAAPCGTTMAQAGAAIEATMDGTQPANLITEAVALAEARRDA